MSRISTSSTGGNVNIQDTNGNPLNSTAGALDVNVVSSSPSSTFSIVSNYTEITSVAPGIETTIVTYSVNPSATCYLQLGFASGQNVASYQVYRNSLVIDKSYTYYTGFNTEFDYRTDLQNAPGILLTTGDIIKITCINLTTGSVNFNGRLQVVEVT